MPMTHFNKLMIKPLMKLTYWISVICCLSMTQVQTTQTAPQAKFKLVRLFSTIRLVYVYVLRLNIVVNLSICLGIYAVLHFSLVTSLQDAFKYPVETLKGVPSYHRWKMGKQKQAVLYGSSAGAGLWFFQQMKLRVRTLLFGKSPARTPSNTIKNTPWSNLSQLLTSHNFPSCRLTRLHAQLRSDAH